jgi:hypothetical protein
MTGRRELAPDRIASLFLPQRTIARSKQGGNAIFKPEIESVSFSSIDHDHHPREVSPRRLSKSERAHFCN